MFKSESLSRPLRVGILVAPDQYFEPWEIALFRRLDQHPAISVELFLTHGHAPRLRRPSAAFRALSAIERAIFRHAPARGSVLSDAGLEHIRCGPALNGNPAPPGLDLVLSHLSGTDAGEAIPPDLELWEYSFNADASGLPELFGFRECLEARPVTQCALLRRMAGGSREVVATCTTNTKLNASFNAQYARDQLPVLVERELVRKSLQPEAAANGAAGPGAAPAPPPEPLADPATTDVLRYGIGLACRVMRRIASETLARLGGQPDKWSLVIGEGDVLASPLDRLRELPQPGGELRADPFLFRKNGEQYVFFERWRRGGSPAKICAGRIGPGGITDISEIDLGEDHVSYPYVFEHRDEIFLIPEVQARNRVEIWRCLDFPSRWTLHATALEGKSPADTVLIEREGQWWMFVNLSSSGILDHCMELHLFRIDGPDLQIVEQHPLNPVVLDTTSARNGGRPFVHQGRLIRPAQNTSHGLYGFGLKLMEITDLSMQAYHEREIRRIEPDRSRAMTGCHHIDSCEDFSIMDVRRAYGSRMLGARPVALRAS